MTDFPSDFEREAHRNERAVDEHRRRQELEAEVERLRAARAALVHRLEALMDRWGSGRNALIRELAIRAIDGDRRVRAETLLRCIEELNMAIPGSDRDDERVRRR
jgi:hypothetical protein